MTPDQANQALQNKVFSKINFQAPIGTKAAYEILSIEFADGSILELDGGNNGEVYGTIHFPDGREAAIDEETDYP